MIEPNRLSCYPRDVETHEFTEPQFPPEHLLAVRIRLLIEEYRAVNQLLLFRLQAMEQRLPLTAAGIGAMLLATAALPRISQVILLIGVPFAVLFWVRSVFFHALSKEDAKVRIREIEYEVGKLCGCPVLRFQSEHPSANGPVGGRTATQAVYLTLVVGGITLAVCYSLFSRFVSDDRYLSFYSLGLCLVALGIGHALFQYAVRQPRAVR